MSDWISVEERLPDYDVTVFVFLKGKERTIGYRSKTDKVGEHFEILQKGSYYEHQGLNVTHWMPLPEPPKS